MRRFYDGVGMFLKTAKSFDARFTHIRNLDVLPFAIYLNDENQRVVKVTPLPDAQTLHCDARAPPVCPSIASTCRHRSAPRHPRPAS